MMIKLVFGSCLALFNGDCLGMERTKSDSDILPQHKATSITHERRSSDLGAYMVAKEKLSWALPKANLSKTTNDIDEALRCVGTNFSNQNLYNLFSKVAENSAYANYVHLMFDECYATNSSNWTFAYISSVLSHAAICYGLQRTFSSKYLVKIFHDSVEADDWGLKP